MRCKALLFALCLALGSGRLSASGGTILPWLGGTQGWDTTPADECDVAVLGQGGDGAAQEGLGLQAGILDTLQAQGQWLGSTGAASSGNLGLRWRQPDDWDLAPRFSAYARGDFDRGVWSPWAGLDLADDPWDADFALNAEAGEDGRWRLRLGAWTPYLLPTLRLGMEASWLDAAGEALTPEALFNLPGDLSLQAGARLDPRGGPPLWTARLSYELFPTP